MKAKNIAAEIAERVIAYAKENPFVPIIVPPPAQSVITGTNFDPETFVLLISDLQTGHKTKTFNFKVLGERMDHLVERTLRITELHRKSHAIPKLEIFLLGDLVHGERVGKTVDLDELEDVIKVQMFDKAIPYLAKAISTFAQHFEQVNVRCVRGNHGKVSKENANTTNWDDMIGYVLEILFKNVPNVKFDVAKDFYQFVDVEGLRFLLIHGDQIPMYLNLPLYGITARAARWQKTLGDFDVMALGHFHNVCSQDWNGTTILVNGTFVTDDAWAQKFIGLKGSCCQTLLSVHPKKGITFTSQIYLV